MLILWVRKGRSGGEGGGGEGEEAAGVEGGAVGAPDGVGVDEGPRDEEDRVLLQQVPVREEGVLGDPAGGGGLGAVAEEFAVGGVQEGRGGGGEGGDVEGVLALAGAVVGCDGSADFGADVLQEGRVRVDGQEHPEECGCGVCENADQIADFEAGDVVDGSAVVDQGVVTRFQNAECVLVVAAVEVLVYGFVELSAACVAFASSILREKSQKYHGEVLLEVPNACFSLGLITSLHPRV